MTMQQARTHRFRTVREFDSRAAKFRDYKVCERCDARCQFSGKTVGVLCADCRAVLSPAERERWNS